MKIDELIRQKCPEGLKRRTIKDFAVRNRGISITADKMRELAKLPGEDVRIFAGGQTIADVSSEHIDPNGIYRTPSIIAKTRGYIDFELYDAPFTHKSEIWSYTIQDNSVDQRYVYYYLKLIKDDLLEYALTRSVKMPQLSVGDLDNLVVPLPPLEVQQEIADTLDLFTGLIESLEREIEITRTLYAVKRDQVIQETLRDYELFLFFDIAKMERGQYFKKQWEKDALEKSDIPILRAGNITVESNLLNYDDLAYLPKGIEVVESKMLKKNDILMCIGSGSKKHSGKVAFSDKDTGCLYGGFTSSIRTTSNDVLPKYLFYVLSSSTFRGYLEDAIQQSTVGDVTRRVIGGFRVPLPPLGVQEQIVEELDRLFATLEGKEKELEMRKNQYTYALDRLFDFSRFD